MCGEGALECGMKESLLAVLTRSVIVPLPSCVPGNQHRRDWRCLAKYVGLHEEGLHTANSEKRLRIIFNEWDKKESVTVAKVHQELTKSQCTRAAECLLSAAQNMLEQDEGEHILNIRDN